MSKKMNFYVVMICHRTKGLPHDKWRQSYTLVFLVALKRTCGEKADVGRAALRCSAAAPADRGVLQSSSSFGIGCRVGCRPSDVHRWRGTGVRRRKNAGSILRLSLPADSASMLSERGEMKCVRWLSLIHI